MEPTEGTEQREHIAYDEWCTAESLVPPHGLRERWLRAIHFPSTSDPDAQFLKQHHHDDDIS